MDPNEAKALASGLRSDIESLDLTADHLNNVAGDIDERWAHSVRTARLEIRSASARLACAAALARMDASEPSSAGGE